MFSQRSYFRFYLFNLSHSCTVNKTNCQALMLAFYFILQYISYLVSRLYSIYCYSKHFCALANIKQIKITGYLYKEKIVIKF